MSSSYVKKAIRFSPADQVANRHRFPNTTPSEITDFMLPYPPIEYRPADRFEKFGVLEYVHDAKFCINFFKDCKYLTFEYDRELDDRYGSQYLMIHSFYVELLDRIYRFYLETPGDEHYPVYILETTSVPLVYTMDIQSRAYITEFVNHTMEHGNNALN